MGLSTKEHFGIIFTITASLPLLLVAISPILMYQNGLDIFFVLRVIVHFSPLSIYDMCSIYSFFATYILTHLVTRRCYRGMDVKLTDFVQLYASSMRGVVSEGNSSFMYDCQLFVENFSISRGNYPSLWDRS